MKNLKIKPGKDRNVLHIRVNFEMNYLEAFLSINLFELIYIPCGRYDNTFCPRHSKKISIYKKIRELNHSPTV